MCGVVIASATELSFNTVGLLFALCSTFTYALLNAFVKKVELYYLFIRKNSVIGKSYSRNYFRFFKKPDFTMLNC